MTEGRKRFLHGFCSRGLIVQGAQKIMQPSLKDDSGFLEGKYSAKLNGLFFYFQVFSLSLFWYLLARCSSIFKYLLGSFTRSYYTSQALLQLVLVPNRWVQVQPGHEKFHIVFILPFYSQIGWMQRIQQRSPRDPKRWDCHSWKEIGSPKHHWKAA